MHKLRVIARIMYASSSAEHELYKAAGAQDKHFGEDPWATRAPLMSMDG